MKRIVLIFGFIAGAMLSVMMVVTLALLQGTKLGHSYLLGYTTMVLAFLMVYFGIRSYRDNVAAGVISYWKGFAIGISITLIGCACYVATWEVVYRKFAPDFYEKYAATVIDGARAKGATQAELDAKSAQLAKQMEMYKNPFANVAFTFIEPFPVGLLFTLVSAGILRRRRRVSSGHATIDDTIPNTGRA
jgi:uncharacterized protein DUF4199